MRATRDWESFVEHGMIIPPHNKDGAIFEAKINAIAHIRSPDSVKALLDLAQKSRRNRGNWRRNVLDALRVLTGNTSARTIDEWTDWWRDARGKAGTDRGGRVGVRI